MKKKGILVIIIFIIFVSLFIIVDLTSKITLTEYWNNPLAESREYAQARVVIEHNRAIIYYDNIKKCEKKLSSSKIDKIKELMESGYRNNKYNNGDTYKIYLTEYRFNRTYIDSKDDYEGIIEELFMCPEL